MDIKPGDTVKIQGSKEVHTVLEQEGSGWRIRDTHGNEVWVPASKIIKKEEAKKSKTSAVSRRPRAINDTTEIPVVNDYFLEHLRNGCYIEGSGPERQRPLFERRYQEATGQELNGHARHMSWTCPERTFGYSLRVCFACPEDLSIVPKEAKKWPGRPNHYDLCSNAFVFELFRLGFTLGWNGPRKSGAAFLPLPEENLLAKGATA